MTPPDIEAMNAAAEKATAIAPGAWEHDTETNDGEFGTAPDTHEGFKTYVMFDAQGRRMFDAHNSDVAEINVEWDGGAWDENSRCLFDFIARANPANVLALIAQRAALLEALEAAQSALAMMVNPASIQATDVGYAWAQCVAAETKARAAITLANGGAPETVTYDDFRASMNLTPEEETEVAAGVAELRARIQARKSGGEV